MSGCGNNVESMTDKFEAVPVGQRHVQIERFYRRVAETEIDVEPARFEQLIVDFRHNDFCPASLKLRYCAYMIEMTMRDENVLYSRVLAL